MLNGTDAATPDIKPNTGVSYSYLGYNKNLIFSSHFVFYLIKVRFLEVDSFHSVVAVIRLLAIGFLPYIS